MKKFIYFLLVTSSAQAGNFFTNEYTITVDYQCMGYDGIPISYNSSMSDCCEGDQLKADPPAKCRAGLASGPEQTGYTGNAGTAIAENALTVAGQILGNNSDGSGNTPNISATSVSPGSESSASVAGGPNGSDGNSVSNAGGATAGSNGHGGHTAGGATAGGAGGSGGLGLSGSGGTSGLKGDPNDPNNRKANGGGYVKGGDGKGSAAGSGGMFGGLFGGAGGNTAGGNTVGAGGPNELAFGEGGETAGGATAGGNGDDDGNGTAEDPSDYFNRIDKSANIFKIVSARYMKKKSLWMIPQSLPEDLKQKKI